MNIWKISFLSARLITKMKKIYSEDVMDDKTLVSDFFMKYSLSNVVNFQ